MTAPLFFDFLNSSSDVDGWFAKEAAAVWDAILSFQNVIGIAGHFLEIGVWKGKSAMMAALHVKPSEVLMLVDPLALGDAVTNIRGLSPNADIRTFQAASRYLRKSNEFNAMRSSFRWIHIDGKHTGQDVTIDMGIADDLLDENGMLVVDDFFSPAYPQVSQAVFRYIERHPYSFQLVICGFQKAYLVRPLAHHVYMEYIATGLMASLKQRGVENITIWKTTEKMDLNAFGITSMYKEFEYRGPDWDQERRPY